MRTQPRACNAREFISQTRRKLTDNQPKDCTEEKNQCGVSKNNTLVPDAPSRDLSSSSPDVPSSVSPIQSPDKASVASPGRSPDRTPETSGDRTSSHNTREFSLG